MTSMMCSTITSVIPERPDVAHQIDRELHLALGQPCHRVSSSSRTLGSVASARAISSRLRPGVPKEARRRIREPDHADPLQHGARLPRPRRDARGAQERADHHVLQHRHTLERVCGTWNVRAQARDARGLGRHGGDVRGLRTAPCPTSTAGRRSGKLKKVDLPRRSARSGRGYRPAPSPRSCIDRRARGSSRGLRQLPQHEPGEVAHHHLVMEVENEHGNQQRELAIGAATLTIHGGEDVVNQRGGFLGQLGERLPTTAWRRPRTTHGYAVGKSVRLRRGDRGRSRPSLERHHPADNTNFAHAPGEDAERGGGRNGGGRGALSTTITPTAGTSWRTAIATEAFTLTPANVQVPVGGNIKVAITKPGKRRHRALRHHHGSHPAHRSVTHG